MTNASRRRIESVTKALRVLRLLVGQPDGVGVTQLALRLGIGKSSAHLLLATLADDDFVVQRPDGRYQLGLGAFEVGAASGGVFSVGGPLTAELRGLAERSSEAVSLASASGLDAVILQRVESVSTLRAEIQIGTRMPLHSSASGKLLLAQMSPDRVAQLFPCAELPSITPSTLGSQTELLEQLAEVRRRGYAWNVDEYTEGVSGVATGVGDATGSVVLSLSIAGPTHRFRPTDWLEDLVSTAQRMSDILQGLAPVVLSSGDSGGDQRAGAGTSTIAVEGIL